MLITIVLLPFAAQFDHSFKEHQYSYCKAQNSLHFDAHELDCAVFHFKINTPNIDFSSEIHLTEKPVDEEKTLTVETQVSSVKIQYKSSRAPPFLLI